MSDSRSLVTRHVQEFLLRGDQQLLQAGRALARQDQIRERQQAKLAAALRAVDRTQAEVARTAVAAGTKAAGANEKHAQAVRRLQLAQERLQRETAASSNAITREAQAAAAAGRHLTSFDRAQTRAAASATRLAASQGRVAASSKATDVALGRSVAAARATTAAYAGANAGAAKLHRTATGTATVLGGGAAFGLSGLAKSALDFEQQMAGVAAVLDGSKSDFRQLTDLAIELGAKTKFSAAESAQAMEILAKAGFDTNQVMSALPGTLALAAASGTDLATSADIQTTALRAFGLAAKDARHVADVLALTANKSAVDVADIGETLAYVAPVARTVGQSFEDVAAAIGIMGNSGLKGSMSGTALRAVIARLVKPTEAADAALERLGTSSQALTGPKGLKPLPEIIATLVKGAEKLPKAERLKALTTIFGREPLAGITTLVDKGSPALERFSKSLQTADGDAKRIARTMQDNVKDKAEQFFGALQSGAIVLEQRFSPSLKRTFDSASDAVGRFVSNDAAIDRVSDTVGNAAETVTHLAAATVPLLKAGAGALKLFTDLPDEVQKSILTFGLLTLAMRKLGGTAALGGLAGQFSRTRQEMALTRAEATATTVALGGTNGGAATIGRASRREVAAGRTANGARLMGAVPFNDLSGTARQQAVLARRQAAAQQRLLAQQQTRLTRMTSALGAATGRLRLPSRGTAVAGVLGGAAGGVLGGGDPLMAAGTGAAIGSAAGPIGALAGGLAGGLGTALVNEFRKTSQARVEDAGRRFAQRVTTSVQSATASGLGRNTAEKFGANQARLRAGQNLIREANDLRANGGSFEDLQKLQAKARAAGLDLKALLDNNSNAAKTAGKDFVTAYGDGLKSKRGGTTAGLLLADFKAQFARTGAEAQRLGAETLAKFATGLQRSGRLPKAQLDKLLTDLKASFPGLAEAMEKAGVDTVERATRTLRNAKLVQASNDLTRNVSRQFGGIPNAVQHSLAGSAAVARSQMRRLRDIMANGSKGDREIASREYERLKRSLGRSLAGMRTEYGLSRRSAERLNREVVDNAEAAIKRGVPAMKAYRDAVAGVGDRLDTARGRAKLFQDAVRDLNAALPGLQDAMNALSQTGLPGADQLAVPDKKPKRPRKRTGGVLRRFRQGGLMPAQVSPGEVGRSPDGSWFRVPGQPVAADSVTGLFEPDTEFFTWSGQAMLAAGASREEALANQAPHFRRGGRVPRGVRVGYTVYDDPEPGAFGALANGYAELGTATRGGRGTGVGWIARALGRKGELPAGARLPITINGRTKTLRKADRGYGQGGDGTRSDPRFAVDIWRDSWRFFGLTRASKGTAIIGDPSGAGDSVALSYGRSRKRAGLLDNAAASGIQAVQTYGSRRAARRYGNPLLDEIREGLAAVEYSKSVSRSGSSSKGGIGGRGRLNWPTASHSLSSRFGNRSSPGGRGSTNHDGIDIPVPTGTAVYAAARGRVTAAGQRGGYGNYVELAHRAGVTTFYGHLSKILTRLGATVNAGAKIALSGNTGTSTGPHLHFGVHRGGKRVDPLSMLGRDFSRGGRVQRFRSGGTAGVEFGPTSFAGRRLTAGTTSLRRPLAGLRRGATDDALKAFDDAIGQVGAQRLQQLRERLLREIRRGGDRREIARLQSAVSLITADLAGRIEENILGVAKGVTARERRQEKRRRAAAIEGVEDSSSAGLSLAAALAGETITSGPAERSQLIAAREKAKREARRAKGKADREAFLDQAQRARDAIDELDARVGEAQVTSAQAKRELPRVQGAERLAHIDYLIAKASRTADPADDLAAQAQRRAELERQLAEAERLKDEARQVELINALQENTSALQEEADQRQTLIDLQKEGNDQRARLAAGLQNEDSRLLALMAEAVNQDLGARYALGRATPTFPGGPRF